MGLGTKTAPGMGLDLRASSIIQGRAGEFHYRPRQLAVLKDSFSSANGTLLSAHTPEVTPGGAWINTVPDTGTPVASTTTVQNGQAAISVAAEGVYIDTGLSDFDLQCNITFGTGTRCGLILRGQSNGNMLTLRFRMPESLIELISSTAGVIAVVGTAQALTYVAGQTYHFRVRADGQTISVYRDGVQVLLETAVTNFQTQTRQGFTSFGSTLDERYDRFIVLPITSSTPK